jgi:stearoyl-CoA desaturase (Delta-9 desaturase)
MRFPISLKNRASATICWRCLVGCFDSEASAAAIAAAPPRQIDWPRLVPFFGLHLACFAVLWVGVSATAIAVAAGLYALRLFAVTGFYHRYFSHRAYRTSRAAQFVFAVLGAAATQRGPLWWASHHRHHHRHADTENDAHSARQHGFAWSHTGWFLACGNFSTRMALVPDLARFPELRLLDRFDALIPVVLGVALYIAGDMLARAVPGAGTSGPQLLVWGLCISTVALYHATFTINSLAHRFGRRRYATRDDSRNNWWLALLTFGEGWHNNHHHFPGAARQGFYWWEIDLTYYGLRLLAALGLIWDLKQVPAAMLNSRRIARVQG